METNLFFLERGKGNRGIHFADIFLMSNPDMQNPRCLMFITFRLIMITLFKKIIMYNNKNDYFISCCLPISVTPTAFYSSIELICINLEQIAH